MDRLDYEFYCNIFYTLLKYYIMRYLHLQIFLLLNLMLTFLLIDLYHLLEKNSKYIINILCIYIIVKMFIHKFIFYKNYS